MTSIGREGVLECNLKPTTLLLTYYNCCKMARLIPGELMEGMGCEKIWSGVSASVQTDV
jgi:hypothetical protein